ncbi:hypothetical protein J2Y02_003003 [Neobacillus drentensis]|nr:hypothetical protein [Neobacillus drentensis]
MFFLLYGGSEGQNSKGKQGKCLSEGFRRTKLNRKAEEMSIGSVPKDKTLQVKAQNVYRNKLFSLYLFLTSNIANTKHDWKTSR